MSTELMYEMLLRLLGTPGVTPSIGLVIEGRENTSDWRFLATPIAVVLVPSKLGDVFSVKDLKLGRERVGTSPLGA